MGETKFFAEKFQAAPLEYLNTEHMQEIHAASLEVLEETGTIIHHEGAVELLKNAGARVEDDKRVYIPEKLVEKAIRIAPSAITIYNRNGESAMQLEGSNVYYGTGSDCPNLLDSMSGERRPFLYKDVEDSIPLVI